LVSKDNNYFFYISILISPKINNIGSLTDEALLFIYLAFKFPMINVLYTAAIEYIFGAYSGLEALPPLPHATYFSNLDKTNLYCFTQKGVGALPT